MHEIPPAMEQTLVEQGFTPAEVDDLRQTGRFERIDESDGTIITVELGPDGDVTSDVRPIPPPAVEPTLDPNSFVARLAGQLAEREVAEGVDIDDDGYIGRVRGVDAARRTGSDPLEPDRSETSGDAPGSTAPHAHGIPDPFVDGRRTSRAVTTLLIAVALLALGFWLLTRSA